MKTIISEAKLHSLIVSALGLSSEDADCSQISYLTADGTVVILQSVVVGLSSESEAKTIFLCNSENWKHPRNLPRFMNQPVSELNISVRLSNCLASYGIVKMWNLIVCLDLILNIRGLGKNSLDEARCIVNSIPGYTEEFGCRLKQHISFLIRKSNLFGSTETLLEITRKIGSSADFRSLEETLAKEAVCLAEAYIF